jgi:hypothetical protein
LTEWFLMRRCAAKHPLLAGLSPAPDRHLRGFQDEAKTREAFLAGAKVRHRWHLALDPPPARPSCGITLNVSPDSLLLAVDVVLLAVSMMEGQSGPENRFRAPGVE